MAVLVISYSRNDQPQVRAIVTLLRTALRGIERAVYWDDDLEPGNLWFEQLKAAIDDAEQLFVFWCAHASTSHEVRREFDYALEQRKRVVPVLLDSTALPDELSAIHGIDLREAIAHSLEGFSLKRPRGQIGGELGDYWHPIIEPDERGLVPFPGIGFDHRTAIVASFSEHLSGVATRVWDPSDPFALE